MLKLKKLAVTGGLSCGKSLVCRILQSLGAYVISADTIVHQLLSVDTNLGQKVIALLGESIVVKGQIDRSRIAQIVFYNPKRLQELEDLLHPAVYEEIENHYKQQVASHHKPSLFVAEVPLLYESKGESHFDKTVAVVSSPENCLRRFIEATGQNETEYKKRTERQLPQIEKAKRADYVMMNNSSLDRLQEITKELYQELLENGF